MWIYVLKPQKKYYDKSFDGSPRSLKMLLEILFSRVYTTSWKDFDKDLLMQHGTMRVAKRWAMAWEIASFIFWKTSWERVIQKKDNNLRSFDSSWLRLRMNITLWYSRVW